MFFKVALLIIMPLLGTAIGSGSVFFMRESKEKAEKVLSGFAGGVMTAASVWSLIIPSVESSSHMGQFAFVPALSGIICAVIGFIFIDRRLTKLKLRQKEAGGVLGSDFFMTFFAVTVHNFPEGLAVGLMCAPLLSGENDALAAAFAFSLAIALQNIPEGAIISLPFHGEGKSKRTSFMWGTLSGAVEPLGAALTLAVTRYVSAALPFLFGLAAGAMLFVVGDELIEKRERAEDYPLSGISFCTGFCIMMVMDVALG